MYYIDGVTFLAWVIQFAGMEWYCSLSELKRCLPKVLDSRFQASIFGNNSSLS